MPDSLDSRDSERLRYEAFARQALSNNTTLIRAVDDPRAHLAAPYRYLATRASEILHQEDVVLEIGAGMGGMTATIRDFSRNVIALDIAESALAYSRTAATSNLLPVCGDMAALPIQDGIVDAVVSAGSLSYAEPALVDAEIRRVLRPGGSLLVVDSLDHNPIYRLNRRVNSARGARTKQTRNRIPRVARVRSLAAPFNTSSVRYFGTADFIQPVLARAVGAQRASDFVSRLNVQSPYTAFKFVLIATGFQALRH